MLQAIPPEDAELYVVLQGSRLTHVTAAKRGDDGLTLSFTAPGKSFCQPFKNTQISFFTCHRLTSFYHHFLSHRP